MAILETHADAPVGSSRTPARSSALIATAVILGVSATVVSAAASWIPSLWGDEVTSILSAERSIPSLFRMLGHVDAVHGTYYLFLHFWVNLFGASPFSVRFPSALAVGFMVAGVVVLASRLAGLRTGVLAGIIAVVLPRVTYMGEEARSYAISAACVVWLTILLVSVVRERHPSRRRWILYALGLAACAYVFLFSLLIVVAHAVVIYSRRDRELRRPWVKSVLGALIVAAPVIAFGIGERGQIAFLAYRDAANPHTLAVTQWFGNDELAVLAWASIVAALVVAIAGWVRRRGAASVDIDPRPDARPAPHLVPLAAVWLLGSMAILVVANAIHPVYSSRYLSFAVPAAALLIGWLLARIRSVWITAVLLVAVVGTSGISYFSERTPYSKNNSDWADVAATIRAHATPGQGILFDESTRPSKAMRLAMHGYPAAFAGLTDIALRSPWRDTVNWHDSTYPLAQVASRLDSVNTVWLVEYRAPGAAADNYDLATLAGTGFTVRRRYDEHASVVIELTRG
jgi:mannosyltransferase